MKPILFSTPMVQAILEGRKTQTRRIIKAKVLEYGTNWLWNPSENKCYSPYRPGDILWVRETFFVEPCRENCPGRDDENECPFSRIGDKCYGYRQQYINGGEGMDITWKPSIHMPRAAARIFLRVTDVRAERVQEISEEDAIAEGCATPKPGEHYHDGMNLEPITSARHAYAVLWDSLSAKSGYGWDANPWVWVYAFERITKEEAEGVR